jgi:acetyl esterase/lipase
MSVVKRCEIYKKVNNNELSLYIFEPTKRNKKELLPLIVFFHGGGWNNGNPDQFFPHCEYLGTRGMIAISAEYRVRSKHGTSPVDSVIDGQFVIHWIRNHSSQLGVDPQKIIAAGGSAGGHIALCTALIGGYKPDFEEYHIDSVPNALVLFNPVVDTVSNSLIASLFEKNSKNLSPIHNIKKKVPPIVIFHGTRDKVVPFKDAELFTRKMKELGNRCELVPFERKGHAFFNFGIYKNNPYKQTLRYTDKFLFSLGFLKGEPTI